jgi:hypothetical protein
MDVGTLKIHKLSGGNKIPVEMLQINVTDGIVNSEIQ